MNYITMPKPLLDSWLTALRTSEINGKPIQQAKDVLNDGGNGYCCLGVLQMVASGSTEPCANGDEYPSFTWLEQHNVQFLNRHDVDNKPYLPLLDKTASTANDSGDTFAEIADAIEATAVGV